MTREPSDDKPELPGGRAAERLREFINQRFPGGVPSPEGANEPGYDAPPETEQSKGQLERLEQAFQQLVETVQRIETRLNRLELVVQELIEAKERPGTSPKEQDHTA